MEVESIKRHFKSRLVGTVLNGYLCLRKLVVQRTKLIDETQDMLLEMLEDMTTGSRQPDPLGRGAQRCNGGGEKVGFKEQAAYSPGPGSSNCVPKRKSGQTGEGLVWTFEQLWCITATMQISYWVPSSPCDMGPGSSLADRPAAGRKAASRQS